MLKPLAQLTFLLLFVCLSPKAWPQDFVYKHYDLQDGLPNPTIHSIFQDRDGFLWIGTESGLCRYDGNRFKTYTVDDGLPDNEVLGTFQDSKGRIWIQFYKNKIAYFYKGKLYNQENDSTLQKINMTFRAYGIAEDGDGNIGIIEYNNLHTISPKNEVVKKLLQYGGEAIFSPGMCTDRDGKLLIASNNGIFKMQDTGLVLVRRMKVVGGGVGPANILMHKNYSTNLYADTLYLRDTLLPFTCPESIMLKFSPVSDSIFSVNTMNGGILYYLGTHTKVNILPGKKVSNVYMDSEKNIWIGTLGSGLYKMSSQVILNKKIDNTDNDILFITNYNDKILVGNNSSELYSFNGKDFSRERYSDIRVLPSLKVLHFETVPGKGTIIANTLTLAIFKNQRAVKGLHTLMLKEVSEYDKDHLMLAQHYGTLVMRKSDLAIVDTVWQRKSQAALRINDSVLVGTMAGLIVTKKVNGRFVMRDSILGRSLITAIKKTTDGLIWVCTSDDGLYCIDKGKIVNHYTVKTGLPSNTGRTLLALDNVVWLGTDKGLVKIERAQDGFQLQKYTIASGLPSNVINSIFVKNETIYVGTPEGLCLFDESMMQPPSICNLRLTAVKIGDSAVDTRNEYRLKSNQQFTIEFSGISMRSEQETVYRYRINGLDDTWRNTSLASLEFTSLPGGDYELEIIATNKFGIESDPLRIALHVAKPIHKTTWFLLLVTGVPLGLTWLIYHRRVQAARKRQVQALQQQVKVIKLEQMALRAQMNPHFIFNCINTIQQLVTEKDVNSTHKFISSFSDLVRQTLDNAPELYIRLAEEARFLTNYFELERIRLEDRFSYKIDIAEVKNPETWMVPNMVIQPFVENAIRHGVRYKKNGMGFIEVKFEEDGSLLYCTITDNGIGREKAAQMRRQSGILHESKSTGITRKRVESLNALTKGMVSLNIEDLYDDQVEAAGTKVTIAFHKITGQVDKDSYN